jgi:hypothetical protein
MSTATIPNRMGRNPFGKKSTPGQVPLPTAPGMAVNSSQEEGTTQSWVSWVAVELPARLYLKALKTWLRSL